MATARALLFVLFISFTLICSSSSTPRKTARIYELRKGDFSIKLTNWGATILSVILPDSKGNLADVALGYEGIGPYINGTTNFGALIGRVANRIAGSRFVLNGTAHRLYPNDGKNSLHGGHRGFSRVFWTVEEKVDGEFPYITFYYYSFDGEQGFPGDLNVFVTYKISGPYELSVIMKASPRTKATPVNLAQHNYWNLGGHNSGSILSNTVQIFASLITPVDENLIPIGSISSVTETPYDFLKPQAVGSRIDEVEGGYDINYVVNGNGMKKVAIVKDEISGRQFELWSNQPGVQFYTGNFLDHVEGKGGVIYEKYAGLCLETQGFPDSVNHLQFPSQIVNPGEVYKHDMVFKFSF
ncbi:hypothetical protein IEQ34_010797 [Dendrobium chrysotoxum]|uniref:Aldose 1-epimerase n=1 Tax=Dendrobium chrysotoxum TaxID=161865 RepID=A0AAV7GWF9_DENCH|nr:hypothetical protein IEQ34_010797 [Dendrobium chrysotoxum]